MAKVGLIKHSDVETLVNKEHRKDNSSMSEPNDDLYQSHELHPLVQILNLHAKITLGLPKMV